MRLPGSFHTTKTHKSRDHVDRASGGKAGNDAHRPRGVGLRPYDPRSDRQRGSTRR
jgi:hypothetical protein